MPRQEDPSGSDSCETSFRAVVQACVAAIDAALAAFLETEDPSGPHKARVALRRLTTAFDAFQPILRRKATARFRSRAKRIFRALGQVRDSDVHLEQSSRKPGAKARRARNRQLRDQVRSRLRKGRAVAFASELQLAAAEGGDFYRRSAAAQARRAAPVSRLATEVLDVAWDRCQDYGASVRAIPETARHDFRKDMKTLRYLAEFFSDALSGLRDEPFRSDFRDIQDALGVLNDYAVALALDGRKAPKRPPEKVGAALEQADRLWSRLRASPPPWRLPTDDRSPA
jgi:CHAD domain-containing protein